MLSECAWEAHEVGVWGGGGEREALGRRGGGRAAIALEPRGPTKPESRRVKLAGAAGRPVLGPWRLIETGRGESGTFALRLVGEGANPRALAGADGGPTAPCGDLSGSGALLECAEPPSTRRVVPTTEEA